METAMHRSSVCRLTLSNRLVALFGALLMICLSAGCTSTVVQDWFKGDFRVYVSGVPEDATLLYVILGKNEALTEADAADKGYAKLVGNEAPGSQFERFEFARQDDPVGWKELDTYFADPESPLTRYALTKKGSMLFKIARHEFKDNAENALAIVVRYRNDNDWKGVIIPMNDFKNKEEAQIEISETGLKRALFDDYSSQQ
jgi:hypothetical protein